MAGSKESRCPASRKTCNCVIGRNRGVGLCMEKGLGQADQLIWLDPEREQLADKEMRFQAS